MILTLILLCKKKFINIIYYDNTGVGNQVCTAKLNINFSHTLL